MIILILLCDEHVYELGMLQNSPDFCLFYLLHKAYCEDATIPCYSQIWYIVENSKNSNLFLKFSKRGAMFLKFK
jgi:hypothetical protein